MFSRSRLACIAWIALLSAASGIADPSPRIVLFRQVEISVGSLEHGAYTNLLQSANQKSLGQLAEWLQGTRAGGLAGNLWLVRGATVALDDLQASKLARQPWVAGVYRDRVRQFVSPPAGAVIGQTLGDLGEDGAVLWGLARIGLPKIRAEFPHLDGTGVRVGILDTGIQSRHPELGNTAGVVFRDFVNNLPLPYDDHGHGTHVAGTIAGARTGLAPKAALVVGKIFTAGGAGTDSAILKGMQWIFDPDGNPETNDFPRLVSNSWGGDLDTEGVIDVADLAPYHHAIEAWIQGGIMPVFAAGNSGRAPNGFPGGLPEALAVGAYDAQDQIAEFSSRGPNLWRVGQWVVTVLKPDISAPGVKITSAFPGNKYATWSGTSMATPHVAGAIALAVQASPKLNYAQMKALLLRTAEKKADMLFGYGVMNAHVLVKEAAGGF